MRLVPDIHELSPASAKLCLTIEHFLQSMDLERETALLAAVSGGADSLALALVLRILAPRLHLRLTALTVDHGLLPEAASIAERVLRQCAAIGIDCVSKKAGVSEFASKNGLGLEEAARELRYRLLEEERAARQAKYIVLGHHSADLAEDVLMRLTRGAGWPALGGMEDRDARKHLLRPLLFTQPSALRALLQECRLDWFEDPSNADLRFKRNRMRHTVLPLLRKENPSLDRVFERLWHFASLDKDYWENILDAVLRRTDWSTGDSELLLPKALLRNLHAAVRLRLYHKVFSMLANTGQQNRQGQPRGDTLMALDRAFAKGRGNACFQLSGGVEAKLNKQGIIFYRRATLTGLR